MFYEWSENLSVNIDSIDRQHRVLIKIINELHDAVENGITAGNMRGILRKLKNYVRVHFVYEELIFKRLDYPETEAHILAHKKLGNGLEKLFKGYKPDDTMIADHLLAFLKDWLNHHILVEDMAYSKFLIEKGIA